MLRERRRLLPAVAVIHLLGVWSVAPRLDAQLTLESGRRLKAGDTIEILLRHRDVRAVDVESVQIDGLPVPFEALSPAASGGAVRLRLRIPEDVNPGNHEITVVFSDAPPVAAVTEVPEIVGLTLEEARRRLGERGLGLDAGAFRPLPAGFRSSTVTRQDPAAGTTARRGSRVAVELAALTEVPEIVGLTLGEARRELGERGLELDTGGVAAAAPGSELWQVRQQTPEAGATVRVGTRVAVVLAAAVPDLVTARIDRARRIILGAGLIPRTVIRPAADGPFETVLEQDPAAGLLVAPGTAVTVAIESIPDPPTPAWPWPWLVVEAGLVTALLRQRAKLRRALRQSYRVEAHHDLDRLRRAATPPEWEGRELGLDVRLLGRRDPGRTILEVDGPLRVGVPER